MFSDAQKRGVQQKIYQNKNSYHHEIFEKLCFDMRGLASYLLPSVSAHANYRSVLFLS
jgi:hypothetical protein